MQTFKRLMQKAADKNLPTEKMLEITDIIGMSLHDLPKESKEEMYFDLDIAICGDEMSREDAEDYVEDFKNEDGTEGAHWSYEDVEKYLRTKGTHAHTTAQMYIVMNMLHSDYYPVIENLTSDITKQTDAYYQMACKFLNDIDAKKHKLKRYKHFISD